MNIYFGHGEDELATKTAEAATPSGTSDLPIILAVSAVIMVAILVTTKLLSIAGQPEPKEKKS